MYVKLTTDNSPKLDDVKVLQRVFGFQENLTSYQFSNVIESPLYDLNYYRTQMCQTFVSRKVSSYPLFAGYQDWRAAKVRQFDRCTAFDDDYPVVRTITREVKSSTGELP